MNTDFKKTLLFNVDRKIQDKYLDGLLAEIEQRSYVLLETIEYDEDLILALFNIVNDIITNWYDLKIEIINKSFPDRLSGQIDKHYFNDSISFRPSESLVLEAMIATGNYQKERLNELGLDPQPFILFAALSLMIIHKSYRHFVYMDGANVDMLTEHEHGLDLAEFEDMESHEIKDQYSASIQRLVEEADELLKATNRTWTKGTHYALRAMEAISYAEKHYDLYLLRNGRIANERSREKLAKSRHAREIAIKRHANHYRLKEVVESLYLAGTFPSLRQAAKSIFPQMQQYARDNGLNPLSEDSGEETVYRWVRGFDKGDV